ncbi:MAG TPA: FliH/SctL family protein [Terriglobia bacterium]|nr:FliH/SctL family protein [Terriglobia bacterium]
MLSNPNPPTNEADPKAQAYVYPPPLIPGAAAKPSSVGSNPSTLERLWTPDAPPAGPPLVSEDQIRAREARARIEGRDEGMAQGRTEFEKKLASQQQGLVQAVRDFARERETYFQRVEAEVVGLAVAIARKILHREAQVDPLLLAGVVRVGLDNVAAGTRVRLKLHPDQIQAWQEFFSRQPDLQSLPELMGDATLGPGHCMLETELGSTDLTLETQLKEIEQGFFDLLAQRPQKQP